MLAPGIRVRKEPVIDTQTRRITIWWGETDGVMYIRRKMLDSVESHAYSTLVEVNCCNVIWGGIVTGNF